MNENSYMDQNDPLVDRLSSLPDDVLCRILSFLPTKLSVLTSILAKRWRFLWANVPNLHFDSEDHHSRMRFFSIISSIALLHKMQSLTAFRFCYEDFDSKEYDIERWITIAIERSVKHIHLDLDLRDRLPQRLFTCKTLVDLSLHHCACVPSSGAVYLPSLKKLDLFTVEFDVDEDLPQLLSGCTVLEELKVSWIMERDRGCCYITSPTIRRLTIDLPHVDAEDYNSYSRVKIEAPALEYLEIFDCSYHSISLSKPLQMLIEASICFDSHSFEVEYIFFTLYVSRFIDSIRNLKCLKLSGSSEEFPHLGAAGRYVRFDNLTRLELTADWRFISKFLKRADNLEVLIIHQVNEKLHNWMDPTGEQCSCLLFSLTTVTIDRFRCTEKELMLVRWFLENAKVLKKMEICCQRKGTSLVARLEAIKKILLFRRGSRECEVVLS